LAFYSHFTDTVKGVVETKNIDLIIMGTKGATGAKEVLFGSNTANVVKKSKCTVIAIPPNYGFREPKEILFPSDYEIQYEKEKFPQLLEIADAYTSTINVLHVSTGYDLSPDQEQNREQLKKLLGNSSIFHDVPDNSVISAVNEFQLETPVDLIVMVQNKHTFMERLFREPVIKKIGFHVTVPFMVIPQL
jgi:nucleotide-binding universal stress UspA family protein